MIVIKPIAVDSTNLTTSTIPEPDASVGEVEWDATRNNITVQHEVISSCFDGAYFWALDSSGVVSRYTEDWVYDSFSFTPTVGGQLFFEYIGITIKDDILRLLSRYVLAGVSRSTIYEYSKLGVDTGTDSGTLPSLSFATSILWDGLYFHITKFGSGASPSLVVKRYDSVYAAYDDAIVDGLPNSSASAITNDGTNFFVSQGNVIHKLTAQLETTGVSYETLTPPEHIVYARSSFFIPHSALMEIEGYSGSFVSVNSYNIGERAALSLTNLIYESAAVNSESPDIGVANEPPTWVEISPTNKYAAFDEAVNTQSISQLTQVVEITPGDIVGGVAGVNITGVASVNVIMTDPTFGEVYNRSIDLIDNTNIIDWFSYLWGAFISGTEFVFVDLPPYIDATIKITITGTGEIGAGALIIGPVITIGQTVYDGTSIQNLDFSLWNEDEFGNLSITKRPNAKLVNFGVKFPETQLNYVAAQLNSLSGIPAVYAGTTENSTDYTLVYGIKRESEINVEPVLCTVPIQVRGLT